MYLFPRQMQVFAEEQLSGKNSFRLISSGLIFLTKLIRKNFFDKAEGCEIYFTLIFKQSLLVMFFTAFFKETMLASPANFFRKVFKGCGFPIIAASEISNMDLVSLLLRKKEDFLRWTKSLTYESVIWSFLIKFLSFLTAFESGRESEYCFL
jgi:hypothetical protein